MKTTPDRHISQHHFWVISIITTSSFKTDTLNEWKKKNVQMTMCCYKKNHQEILKSTKILNSNTDTIAISSGKIKMVAGTKDSHILKLLRA